jgi:hypothetical protein
MANISLSIDGFSHLFFINPGLIIALLENVKKNGSESLNSQFFLGSKTNSSDS